jgi:hypothetical protein
MVLENIMLPAHSQFFQISNKTTFKYKLELFYASEKIWSLTFSAEYFIESGAKHHSDNHQDRTWISFLPFEEFFFNSCNFGHFVYGVGEYHASSTFTILLMLQVVFDCK